MARAKSKKIADPALYFSNWCYKIDSHHFESLGVTLREFVKDKIPYNSYAVQSPPDYQLLQGYIFYKASSPSHFLQIASEFDAFNVEVHCGEVGKPEKAAQGYVVNISDFAEWLRTGDLPTIHRTIDLASSKGGLLAWQLVEKIPTLNPEKGLQDTGQAIESMAQISTPSNSELKLFCSLVKSA